MLTMEPPLIGPRVLVRPFRATDLDDVSVFQSDPLVLPFIPWQLRTPEETREWLEQVSGSAVREEGDHGAWAVERKQDGRVIGSVNLSWVSRLHGQAEFGFVLATDAQGSGYATEATSVMLDAAFPTLDLHRAYARVDARNEASLRMLRRWGMRQEAYLRGREFFKGEWTDIVIFAVLRQEWAARRPPAASPTGVPPYG